MVKVAAKRTAAKKVVVKPLTVAQKLAAMGIEKLCERLIAGETQTAIAASIGVSKASLIAWVAAEPDRSARAREARIAAAATFDDMAEQGIRNAKTPFGLAKARELAHHYRWKASKANPREYGDRTTLAGDPVAPLAVLLEQIAANPRSRLTFNKP